MAYDSGASGKKACDLGLVEEADMARVREAEEYVVTNQGSENDRPRRLRDP